VRDGDMVGVGGNSLARRPVALVRELIRAGRRDLTVVAFTAGFETELLLAAGRLRAVRACYVGLDYLGLAPHFGRDPAVHIWEETEASIVLGLKATASHVSFLPFRGVRQTDVLRVRPDVQLVRCPYTGEEYVAWPALQVDVALIHAPACDADGNAVLGASRGIDRLLGAAARTTIVSAERLVGEEEIRRQGADLLGHRVAAVVHAPYGAHPTSCYPYYRADVPHLLDYLDRCREGRVTEYLQAIELDHGAYVQRFVAARAAELALEKPVTGGGEAR
ncbi:MAG: CoA transferase subunit A, partial [Clostridia bacterium]|nr:CoA transferase subunit A [Clostridia bacterium]